MNRHIVALTVWVVMMSAVLAGCGGGGGAGDSSSSMQQVSVAPVSTLPKAPASRDLVAQSSPVPGVVDSSLKASPHLQVGPRMREGAGKSGSKAATWPGSCYTVAQIRQAYGSDRFNGTGQGQIIGIVEAYGSPTIRADLEAFSQAAPLVAANLRIFDQDGREYGSELLMTPGGQSPSDTEKMWALETALDVEWAHAMAPGASIVLVVAKTDNFLDLLAAVDIAVAQGARQVSMSWGNTEVNSPRNLAFHFDRTGVSFFASSGDQAGIMNWPAAASRVCGVGGSTVTLNPAGNVVSEVAWSGGGGGLSSVLATIPDYQQRNASAADLCGSVRGGPDVSYNANPEIGFAVYSTADPATAGWRRVGGTSAGAPQWAALTALANALRATLNKPPLNGINSVIYTFPRGSLRDVMTGSNGNPALMGYDLATGLGSPMSSTVTALSRVAVVQPTPTPTPAPTPTPTTTPTPAPECYSAGQSSRYGGWSVAGMNGTLYGAYTAIVPLSTTGVVVVGRSQTGATWTGLDGSSSLWTSLPLSGADMKPTPSLVAWNGRLVVACLDSTSGIRIGWLSRDPASPSLEPTVFSGWKDVNLPSSTPPTLAADATGTALALLYTASPNGNGQHRMYYGTPSFDDTGQVTVVNRRLLGGSGALPSGETCDRPGAAIAPIGSAYQLYVACRGTGTNFGHVYCNVGASGVWVDTTYLAASAPSVAFFDGKIWIAYNGSSGLSYLGSLTSESPVLTWGTPASLAEISGVPLNLANVGSRLVDAYTYRGIIKLQLLP